MALKHKTDGRYLKVITQRSSVESGEVHYDIYQSEADKNNPTEWTKVLMESFHTSDLKDFVAEMADNGKSILDNLTTACYLALKNHPDKFTDWEDA